MKGCQTFYASADPRTNRIPQTNDNSHSNVSKTNSSTSIRSSKPKCGKCKNHGVTVDLRGHSANCPNKDCRCKYCILQEERRYLAKLSKEVERQEPSGDPYRTLPLQAWAGYNYNLPDKNFFFGQMRSPVQLMMPSSPIPGSSITPDATPHLGHNNPGRPSKVAYPGSPRTISVHSTSTVDDFLSSSSDGSSPPHRPSAFREVSGGLDPNQKYKAMERFHCLLMRKLGDSYDLLPLLVLAVLAEYNFDPDEVKRKIQSVMPDVSTYVLRNGGTAGTQFFRNEWNSNFVNEYNNAILQYPVLGQQRPAATNPYSAPYDGGSNVSPTTSTLVDPNYCHRPDINSFPNIINAR